MIFYFYFNPQHTHHSWLTHSGNKGPRRDAPRSFVAVDERFFLSLVRGSLSKADASAMPNTWCFMQCKSQGSQTGFSLSSRSSCSHQASPPPCTVAFSIIPLMGLMIFPLLKHESNIQITLEGTRKKLWFYLTPVTSLTENQWYLSQRQEKQIPCGRVIHLSRQYIWWFIAALPHLKTLSIRPETYCGDGAKNPTFN